MKNHHLASCDNEVFSTQGIRHVHGDRTDWLKPVTDKIQSQMLVMRLQNGMPVKNGYRV